MIALRVLGEISLRGDDGEELGALLRQPKRLSLLAYLAAPSPGVWHRRDMLLALFWPELDSARGRTTLRNAIYVLRQSLGEDVVRSRGDEEVSINPDRLETDLAAVWEALRNGRPADALARYGGELLQGLYPPDSEGFMRWLDAERARVKAAVAASARTLLAAHEAAGEWQEALAVAHRMLNIQPDDESIVRAMMTLHERLGSTAGALRVFEDYRTRLAADFGAEPAPETLAIVERLRARRGAPTITRPSLDPPQPRQTVTADRSAAPVFVPAAFERASRMPKRRNLIVGAVAVVMVAIVLLGDALRPGPEVALGKSTPLTSAEGLQIEAAISPNGRLVAYAQGNPMRLRIMVQRIAGGSAWPLTSESTNELMPRWSPDNDALLYLAHNGAYVTAAVAGTPRPVARGTPGDGMVRSATWSPNGDSIAIVRNDSLLVLPAEGSGSRYVGTGYQLHSCVWSPDGKWIACVSGNWLALAPGPLFGNQAPSAVLLFPARGGTPMDLTGAKHEHRGPAWTADGRELWIISDRDGVINEVYSIAIGADGRADAFRRIGLVAEAISLSADRVAYSAPSRRANIWSLPVLDDRVGDVALATRLTSGNQVIEVVSVSSDDRWLLYDSDVRGNADIYRISLVDGTHERLTSDPRPEYAPSLSPDGIELAWHRITDGVREVIVRRIDAESPEQKLGVRRDHNVARWSPDGTAIAAWSHTTEEGVVFVVRRNGDRSWQPPAWWLAQAQLPMWSPDGRTLAYVTFGGSVEMIPADSGARRVVYAPRQGSDDPVATYLIWRSPGWLWFLGHDPSGRNAIWRLDLDGSRPRIVANLTDPMGRTPGPAIASDGSRFYFPLDERSSNIRWAELGRR